MTFKLQQHESFNQILPQALERRKLKNSEDHKVRSTQSKEATDVISLSVACKLQLHDACRHYTDCCCTELKLNCLCCLMEKHNIAFILPISTCQEDPLYMVILLFLLPPNFTVHLLRQAQQAEVVF